MPPGKTWRELADGAAEWETILDALINAPKGGGGGGRSRAPYVRPDERLVRSAIEGAWDGLTGTVDQFGVGNAIKEFYKDDRANYDNQGQQIDAMESVLEIIRATSEYKAIHALRSESQDERTWISSKVGRLLQAGVSQPLAQELGVAQAQAGSGSDTVQSAGEAATLITTGRALDSHKRKMQQSMGRRTQRSLLKIIPRVIMRKQRTPKPKVFRSLLMKLIKSSAIMLTPPRKRSAD